MDKLQRPGLINIFSQIQFLILISVDILKIKMNILDFKIYFSQDSIRFLETWIISRKKCVRF